jgi:hypothetical protein
VVYSIIYRVSTIQGGAGFLPSTESRDYTGKYRKILEITDYLGKS